MCPYKFESGLPDVQTWISDSLPSEFSATLPFHDSLETRNRQNKVNPQKNLGESEKKRQDAKPVATEGSPPASTNLGVEVTQAMVAGRNFVS
jgi:hypothetical protein